MTYFFASAALLLAAQPAPAAPAPVPSTPQPQLSLEQATGLRCGVTFALVAQAQVQAQARGEGAQYPALGTRGREFFVRTMARLMDENALPRDVVSALALRETRAMAAAGPEAVDAVMPACLQLLDLSGL